MIDIIKVYSPKFIDQFNNAFIKQQNKVSKSTLSSYYHQLAKKKFTCQGTNEY
jgi:hypothetical protein